MDDIQYYDDKEYDYLSNMIFAPDSKRTIMIHLLQIGVIQWLTNF